jgi:hypothetical protein
MKILFLLSLIATLLISASDCSNKKTEAGKYKGKLEVAGMCMNYTIKVIDGNIDTSLIVANWMDDAANKTHTNVFRLKNPCNFPAGIKEGDEFYFMIDSSATKQCAVCMAYYPTPSKAVAIKVLDK